MNTKALILFMCIWMAACSPKNADTNNTSSTTNTDETSETQEVVRTEGMQLTREVNPPLPSAAPKPEVFTINPSKENVLTSELGSTITIPKDAFVDAAGNPVKGEVKIAFTEYHTASDIILSGIPMHIESEDGNLETFETAGMFDIQGTDTKGNEIRVANNKTLAIELTTYKEDEDYNFYTFDKEENLWKEEYKNTLVAENTARVRLTEEYEAMGEVQKPLEIKKASSSDFVFELAVDKAENPEFSHFDDVLWKLTDNTIEDAQLFRQTIANPNLTCIDRGTSTYKLTGSAGGRKVSTKVQPVLFGSNWKKAQARFNKKLQAYKTDLKDKENKKERLNRMSKLQRNLAVSGFGTYNCDRYSRMKGRRKIQFNAVFLLPAIQKVMKRAYLIIKKGAQKEAVPVYGGIRGTFMYAPHENNTLITFDDDGNLYEFTAKQLEQVTARNPRADSEQTLNFMKTTYRVASEADMTAYLDRL